MQLFRFNLDIIVPFSEYPLVLSCNSQMNPQLRPPKWKVGLAGIIDPSINFLNDTVKFRQLSQDTPQLLDGFIENPPQPFVTQALHGVENGKNSWSLSFLPPVQEIEHIADIAFIIRGESLPELYYHAFIALSFYEPSFLRHHHRLLRVNSLDDIIFNLNSLVSAVDAEQGCAFKAVSYHGDIRENQTVLAWEMIIDV